MPDPMHAGVTLLLTDPIEAAALLRAGQLVGFATETVYGLGGDARNARAVAAIFEAKGRPHFNPLICHYPSAEAAWEDVVPDARAHRLAAAFWPGPLTMVLPRRPRSRVDLLAGAGLDTLAVRVPAHTGALALLRAAATPIAAPSANRSGRVSPTTSAHVLEELSGRIAAVLEGGACAVGVESSVLDLTSPGAVLLRPGGAAREAIEAIIGPIGTALPLDAGPAPTLRSPGLMLSHYAPTLPLRLNATSLHQGEALLAFGTALPGGALTSNLSESGDTTEAAAHLFSALRWLDAEGQRRGLGGIAAQAVPMAGLGVAINDRLTRAAAPRDPSSQGIAPRR